MIPGQAASMLPKNLLEIWFTKTFVNLFESETVGIRPAGGFLKQLYRWS